jgi:hypothetical protein
VTKYVENAEQKERRRIRDKVRAAKNRAARTPDQRRAAIAANSAYQKKRRMEMTPDERLRLRREVWIKYHGESYRKRAAEYMRMKRRTDERFAIAERLRARVKTATRRAGACKAAGTEDLTGCSADALASWMERQFSDGMSWQNRSEWHIDHIIPCSAFDLRDEYQQRVAFHYTNLRPLWKSQNMRKSSSVPLPQKKFLWTLKDVADARKRLGAVAGPRMEVPA